VTRGRACAGLAVLVVALAFGCGSPTSGRPITELWKDHCANCHGDDGHGDPARRRLDPRIDLRRSEMIAAGDSGLVFQRIAYGYGAMPGFIHKMPRGDVEQLAAFCATLARR